jgi:TOD1/MUCI70, glycosyltransferase-like domain
MTAAILTAVYDGYDSLKPLPVQDVPHEAICVTDDPNLHAEGWTIVYEPRSDVHPNRAAKTAKMCPWRYTDADLTVWVDAMFEIKAWSLLSDVAGYTFGQWIHPDRQCIYEEATVSATMSKYAGEPVAEQAAHYRTLGHPAQWGLWAAGFIVRQRTPEIEAFGEAWLAEVYRWSFQDQISEAPMLRQYGLRPEVIPGAYHQNPWMLYAASPRH